MKAKTADQYLQAPYSRVLIPDPETGTYTAQILEFPGCISQGDTPADAYKNLEEAAKSWIRAAIEMKQTIPEPVASNTYGGKLLVRLPKSLHRDATQAAEREGASVNQYVVVAVAEKVKASNIRSSIVQAVHEAMSGWMGHHGFVTFHLSGTFAQGGIPMFGRTAGTTDGDLVVQGLIPHEAGQKVSTQ